MFRQSSKLISKLFVQPTLHSIQKTKTVTDAKPRWTQIWPPPGVTNVDAYLKELQQKYAHKSWFDKPYMAMTDEDIQAQRRFSVY